MSDKQNDFRALAASYILGECDSININGPEEKARCISEVLRASRQLYVLLENPAANLKDVLSVVAHKNLAAQKYKKVTGKNWYF